VLGVESEGAQQHSRSHLQDWLFAALSHQSVAVISGLGYALTIASVTKPEMEPLSPRKVQKISVLAIALAMMSLPSVITNSYSRTRSMPKQYLLENGPWPPAWPQPPAVLTLPVFHQQPDIGQYEVGCIPFAAPIVINPDAARALFKDCVETPALKVAAA
jgi:hypothetical protein